MIRRFVHINNASRSARISRRAMANAADAEKKKGKSAGKVEEEEVPEGMIDHRNIDKFLSAAKEISRYLVSCIL
jgi:hypothetical protein